MMNPFSRGYSTSKDITESNIYNLLPVANRVHIPPNEINKELVIWGSNRLWARNYPKYTTILKHIIK